MTNNTGNFRVITNDNKKVFKPSCVVKLNDSVDKFEEFVTIGYDKDRYIYVLLQNGDITTLAYALKYIRQVYMEQAKELSNEDRIAIEELFIT